MSVSDKNFNKILNDKMKLSKWTKKKRDNL
jgi:hypothetical protein